MKEVLIDSRNMYKLFKADTKYILTVVCGGIGMYERSIALTDEEVEKFRERGESYIDELACDVSKNEAKYRDRAAEHP